MVIAPHCGPRESIGPYDSYCTHHHALIQKWHAWAERSAGSGERRELALGGLLDCLQRNALDMDLSGLNLTELPEMPPGIEHLNASHNALTALFFITPGLKYLDVSHNSLEYLPSVPSTNEEMNISDNKFETLPFIDHVIQKVD